MLWRFAFSAEPSSLVISLGTGSRTYKSPRWPRYNFQRITALFCLFGLLTSSSNTKLYRGRTPRQSVCQFYVLPHMRQTWETMTSVSAGHIILTPTQPVGSGRPQRESNPGPPHQEQRITSAACINLGKVITGFEWCRYHQRYNHIDLCCDICCIHSPPPPPPPTFLPQRRDIPLIG